MPAILEHLPYCKRDGTTARDDPPYLPAMATLVRVDMRAAIPEGLMQTNIPASRNCGTPSTSSLAAQPRTARSYDGHSVGGFNSLQVARWPR